MAAEVARVMQEAAQMVDEAWRELSGSGAAGAEEGESQKSPSFRESLRTTKRKGKWNGRVSDLTMKEYRDMKWGMDAGYRAALRVGPRWSMRGSLSKPPRANSDGMLPKDPAKAYDACYNTAPKFTIGKSLIGAADPLANNPGPQYLVPSTMNPSGHPTIWKNSGAKFGSETLQVNDEDGPAPGQYDQNAFKHSGQIRRAPVYTAQGREAWRDPVAAPGPVPGEYNVERALRNGKITPFKWTMQGKTEPLSPPRGERATVKPGPGHYKLPSIGERNAYPHIEKPPLWKFLQEPRGLLPT
mmetsp:Transcript_119768/g.284560  ORF Transcript_119768/g.284560 Transcript_119768/m.284560 type:complete len:299 (-) Transcript_119768:42-938(-)|eukprot:CAMPEP_0181524810 /NCGR_PEP_ID=MMETSP1110-20121109/68636_1 /TAXON_ID=174948 /ORGANISM="Symbiodinium sp., Strain CCMP421" /LENGTH=298 /DNA_ID=CAMNT_0023655579 /DNA_START=38 /DNA_END=934 /DNA_ORIENTATION=-